MQSFNRSQALLAALLAFWCLGVFGATATFGVVAQPTTQPGGSEGPSDETPTERIKPVEKVAASLLRALRSHPTSAIVALDGAEARNRAIARTAIGSRTPGQADRAFRRAYESEIAYEKDRLRQRHTGAFETLTTYPHLSVEEIRLHSRRDALRLAQDPLVLSIQPNRLVSAASDQARGTARNNLSLIEQPTAYGMGATGRGASIAVLDTGVDFSRKEFGSCTAAGPTCRVVAALDSAPDDGSRDDASRHGTNVAAIAAAVAPKAKIVSVDVFDGGEAQTSDILSGLDWVLSKQEQYNIRSVNMSIGNSTHFSAACTESPFTQPFQDLAAFDVVPVVSSGNFGVVNGTYQPGVAFPACTPGAVRVGAVHDTARDSVEFAHCRDQAVAADSVACFSQGGQLVSVLAPGVRVAGGGTTQSGTSQAAPHVAGALAALSSAFPKASAGQLAQSLGESSTLLTDAREDSSAGFLFFPRLDIANSLRALDRATPAGFMAGDEDNFGYRSAPVQNAFFDHTGVRDLGVFDRELNTSGDQLDTWTHDLRDSIPAEFTAKKIVISIREVFSDFEAATVDVDGISLPLLPAGAAPSKVEPVVRTMVLGGSQASVANDGVLNVTFSENGDDIALDWARVRLVGSNGVSYP